MPTEVSSGTLPILVPEDALAELVALFKLVADETRLRILYYLTERPELHVRGLCELLKQSQPAVSHHLALLRLAGLIDRRRQGKHNYYGIRASRLTGLLDAFFSRLPDKARAECGENIELSPSRPQHHDGQTLGTRGAGAEDRQIT